ncbi:MAG: hypothetical protein RLZZ238_2254 [Planctomycetota bacterium]|jgi:hypothetical protein
MDGMASESFPRRRSRVRARRGGLLLELLLSIALFVAAASFALSALRSALDGIGRAEMRARAFDLASSRLAELDAGLVAIGDLGDERFGDSDLAVTIELEAGSEGQLTRARAIVRDMSVPGESEPPIVLEHERWITLRERGGSRDR